MLKKLLIISTGLYCLVANAQQDQNDDAYWCKYLNNCNTQQAQPQSVPQEDPYSTGTYNDGGPVGYTGQNNAPYYDPYNTPGNEQIEMPVYGGDYVGYGGYNNTTINRNGYQINNEGGSDFNIPKR